MDADSAHHTDRGAAPAAPRPRPRWLDPDWLLAFQVALSAVVAFAVTGIWAGTSRESFWPIWVWFSLGVLLALHWMARSTLSVRGMWPRLFRLNVTFTATLIVTQVVIWAASGGGLFWPIFPAMVFGGLLAIHAAVYYDRLPREAREAALVERVDELTRTRRGALDVQAAELRRIERDLHDGAQARLVALSIHLGRAEEQLADRPETAELVRRARQEATAAVAELRDLARGIAPPILADRGLAAAVEALGRRQATAVEVDVELGERPPPVVETAAYFVVAESLTNVAKHGGGGAARVHISMAGDTLHIEVADEGPGGADANGSGLTGLRHRVEALDGTLRVESPAGGGTVVRAELPCVS
jgi:signal transduction histidine kinase